MVKKRQATQAGIRSIRVLRVSRIAMTVRQRIEAEIQRQLREARLAQPSPNLERACSFCGKSIPKEMFLIRGVRGAICSSCITTFSSVIAKLEAALKTDAAESEALIATLEKSLGVKP